MRDADILGLADAADVVLEWTDAHGAPQRLAPDAVRTILAALDLPCATETQCKDSHARVAAARAPAALPPSAPLTS